MLNQPAADPHVAGHGPQHKVKNGPQDQRTAPLIGIQIKVPADAAGPGQAVPLRRNSAAVIAVAQDKLRIVAAVAQRSL